SSSTSLLSSFRRGSCAAPDGVGAIRDVTKKSAARGRRRRAMRVSRRALARADPAEIVVDVVAQQLMREARERRTDGQPAAGSLLLRDGLALERERLLRGGLELLGEPDQLHALRLVLDAEGRRHRPQLELRDDRVA